jgi:CheY-like chemotaxis protein
VFSAVDRAFAMNLAEQSAQALDRARLYAGERAAKRGAEEASRLKDEFLATVSHELRTPLNAILGWASMLRSGRLDLEAVERALATIERNARAQARLVDDVLDVSRIISGKLGIRTEPLEVGSVLHQALDVVRPAALAKEVVVEVDVARSLRVRGDTDRLQQVYWNVLANAVKFTPRRGKISVRAFASDGSVVVTVTDTGQGVCPDFLPHLFEPFRQADGSTTRAHGGLGLGLSIARHLVQLHGGDIAATSPGEGRGSTFTITLPETAEVPQMLATGRHRPAARLRGLDVLVVDDDEDARELTAMVLAGEGAVVRTASSAKRALAHITEKTPAILVCDIGMPEEDGLSLLPRARAATEARGERFPALAFTAYADAEHAELVQRAGFDAHLTKPVDAPALVSAVADLASAGPTSSSAARPG